MPYLAILTEVKNNLCIHAPRHLDEPQNLIRYFLADINQPKVGLKT